jgi:23S rRNA (adenine2030-N6)-methyltransferase
LNYRHAYHAGNFADVLKHAALVAVLGHLRKKETPFAVIDTHAGRGLYDLTGAEAQKTGEAAAGIARLLKLDALPGVLELYCGTVRGFGSGLYPGSPLIAAKLLRAQDRLVAVEKQDEEFRALALNLTGVRNAKAMAGDGYAELKRLMPPAERRGVVLIDPPYEAEDEFQNAVRALIGARTRFATGIFLFWYPMKESAAVAASIGEILNSGVKSLLRAELDVGPMAVPDGTPRLSATGLLVVNPPFGFEAEMNRILPFLAAQLAQGEGARFTVQRLAGDF